MSGGTSQTSGRKEPDFESAWSQLDSARNLFESELESAKDKGAEAHKLDDPETPTDPVLLLKKKLSDTYDLMGEVSLEAKNYAQAANDLNNSLKIREDLYKEGSLLVSEVLFKLSLAYEFMTEDPTARNKAAQLVKTAIETVNKQIPCEDENEDEEVSEELLEVLTERYEKLVSDP